MGNPFNNGCKSVAFNGSGSFQAIINGLKDSVNEDNHIEIHIRDGLIEVLWALTNCFVPAGKKMEVSIGMINTIIGECDDEYSFKIPTPKALQGIDCTKGTFHINIDRNYLTHGNEAITLSPIKSYRPLVGFGKTIEDLDIEYDRKTNRAAFKTQYDQGLIVSAILPENTVDSLNVVKNIFDGKQIKTNRKKIMSASRTRKAPTAPAATAPTAAIPVPPPIPTANEAAPAPAAAAPVPVPAPAPAPAPAAKAPTPAPSAPASTAATAPAPAAPAPAAAPVPTPAAEAPAEVPTPAAEAPAPDTPETEAPVEQTEAEAKEPANSRPRSSSNIASGQQLGVRKKNYAIIDLWDIVPHHKNVEKDVLVVEEQINDFLRTAYEVPEPSEEAALTKAELLKQAANILAKAMAMPDEGTPDAEMEAIIAKAKNDGKEEYKAAIAAL